MFEITWEERALQELNKLDNHIIIRILKKVDGLGESPFSKNVKKIRGSDFFRLRIGDYRAIFSIDGNLIKILKIGHRKNIYKK